LIARYRHAINKVNLTTTFEPSRVPHSVAPYQRSDFAYRLTRFTFTASSLGSASSNGSSALNGPKSDLDEGGEDDRVRVPSSIRSSSAGVGRSERTSLGLTVLCSPSSAAPSFSARSWGSEGDPRVLPGALCSLRRVLLRSGAASEVEFLHRRCFALQLAVFSPLSPEAPTLARRA
jgi:hypothetical protein